MRVNAPDCGVPVKTRANVTTASVEAVNETLSRPMPCILCWNVPVSLESGSSFHGDVPPGIHAMPWSSPEVSPRAALHEAVRQNGLTHPRGSDPDCVFAGTKPATHHPY